MQAKITPNVRRYICRPVLIVIPVLISSHKVAHVCRLRDFSGSAIVAFSIAATVCNFLVRTYVRFTMQSVFFTIINKVETTSINLYDFIYLFIKYFYYLFSRLYFLYGFTFFRSVFYIPLFAHHISFSSTMDLNF